MIDESAPTPRIEFSQEALGAFCRKWMITVLSFFGSVLRDDFGPDSDVDVLVTFAQGSHWTLLDLVRMETELSKLFGRKVDLVVRDSVERSKNPRRRREILTTAQQVYAA